MGQKSRNDLTSVIGSNIFDNNNKEITSSMVRNVLNDFRDSKFNLIDDELKNVTYRKDGGNKVTLEQYLNSVVGALPIYGTVEGIDVGHGKSQPAYDTSGIISNASAIGHNGSPDSLIEINFSQKVANRRLIPVLTYPVSESNWDVQNDICVPVIRRMSSEKIHVAIREISGNAQNITLEIIAI